MKQLLLICAVVVMVGCWKKDPSLKKNIVRVQRSTPYQEPPQTTSDKFITDPIVEKAIRAAIKKPEGELTKSDLDKVTALRFYANKLTEVPKELEKLTQLEYLALGLNQLTSVKGLEKLTQLTKLHLYGNQLTDVKGLENLDQLRSLNLYNNPALTKAQIAELQKALPKCKIVSDFTK